MLALSIILVIFKNNLDFRFTIVWFCLKSLEWLKRNEVNYTRSFHPDQRVFVTNTTAFGKEPQIYYSRLNTSEQMSKLCHFRASPYKTYV